MKNAEERIMQTWDGSALFYRAWLPSEDADKAVILLHRGHEHSGRWQDVAQGLDLPNCAVFAWDMRGHGRSAADGVELESFGSLVKDLECFVRHLARRHGIPVENVALLANSVGAVVASAWVHDYAPPIRALVLASPALRVKLYLPFAIAGLRLWSRLAPKASVSSYVKGRHLTGDPVKSAQYDSDPLIDPAIRVKVLLGLHDASTRLIADAAAIETPVLMLTAGADKVVQRSAQEHFFEALGSARKEMRLLPGFLHDIFNETENDRPIALAGDFLREAFVRPLAASGRTTIVPYAQQEFLALARPLPLWSPRRWAFGLQRLTLRSLGSLSEGIRVGWRHGFDSGVMLDYVYRNQARGWTPLGRLIDRLYLDSVGWRGIRQRKVNLERLIDRAMVSLTDAGRHVDLLDVAAGGGRYLLDAIQRRPALCATALLRDFHQVNIDAGRDLIAKMGLTGRATFVRGDAFDGEDLARIEPRPTVAVVSGLYELFPDNDRVSASLAGLGRAIQPGGYLLYTNQPWHPQIETIARVLPSHREGAPWTMRRRSQAEMDRLVRQAGFEKLAMEIDEDGIFTVSLARRLDDLSASGQASETHPEARPAVWEA